MPFFGIGMKTDLFLPCGHHRVFQICWHIECNTFTASSFRIWNRSTGIPPPLLSLFIVMLPKAHLTSHSRMFALGVWSHYHGYLGHEYLFCTVLSFIVTIFMKCSLGISNFLEEISSLSHSIVFLHFFALITEEGFLSLFAILWNSAFKWVYLSFLLCQAKGEKWSTYIINIHI